jgi:hypothetical protein
VIRIGELERTLAVAGNRHTRRRNTIFFVAQDELSWYLLELHRALLISIWHAEQPGVIIFTLDYGVPPYLVPLLLPSRPTPIIFRHFPSLETNPFSLLPRSQRQRERSTLQGEGTPT